MKTWFKLLLFVIYSIIVIYIFHFTIVGNDIDFSGLLLADIFVIVVGWFIIAPLLSIQIKPFLYRLLFVSICCGIGYLMALHEDNKSDKPYIFNVRIVD